MYTTLQHSISARIPQTIVAHQYADDIIFIAAADQTTLSTLKLILRLFSPISGLHINLNKNCFVPFHLDHQELIMASAILRCPQKQLPVTYLGMPFMCTNQKELITYPSFEKMQRRLAGWRGKLISRGGRLQLINSVLSVIPVYFMNCFRLPKWVLNQIDKIRRVFLWASSQSVQNPMSLVNWQMVCLPKCSGGLGITNLQLQNMALLLRWWWRLYTAPSSLWTITVTSL